MPGGRGRGRLGHLQETYVGFSMIAITKTWVKTQSSTSALNKTEMGSSMVAITKDSLNQTRTKIDNITGERQRASRVPYTANISSGVCVDGWRIVRRSS